MKRLLLSLLCLALGAGVCEAKKSAADSPVLSREVRLDSPCTALRVGDMIQVYLEAESDPCVVRIETHGIAADRVRAQVQGGTLVLRCDRKAFRKAARKGAEPIRAVVRVGMGAFASFDCAEMSAVHADAPIEQPTVEIRCEGMSEAAFDLDCSALYLRLGTGSAYRGRAVCSEDACIEASGLSTVVSDLQCGALALELGECGHYRGEIDCSDRVQVAATGMSSVTAGMRSASLYMELSSHAEYNGKALCRDDVCIAALAASRLNADLACRNAVLELDNHSSFDGELACDDARIALSDRSDCSLAGTTRELSLETSGMSKFRGSRFTVTGSASCLAAGMSTVQLRCTGDLIYDVSQQSELIYQGDPNIRASVVESGVARSGSLYPQPVKSQSKTMTESKL